MAVGDHRARWPPKLVAARPALSVGHAAVAGAAVAVGLVVARVAPDVSERPLHPDEAVAGLVAARPLGEALVTTFWERGGAPLHVLLANPALLADTSPEALRALSVVFAAACVAVCFLLGRALAGPAAGVVAAAVAASSTLLGIYGSFGRMYALFPLAAAVAALTFLHAVRRPSSRAALVAVLGAWLLAASHPYGAVLAVVEVAVGLVLWRGRPLRPAVPALVAGLGVLAMLLASWRLAGRFDVGVSGSESVASPGRAWDLAVDAFASFAGGDGVWLVLAGALALVGFAVLVRTETPFAALALLSIVAVPVLLFVARSSAEVENLSPRHFAYALPYVAAAIGVAVAWLTRGRPVVGLAVAAGVSAAAFAAPGGGLSDPRSAEHFVETGARSTLVGPAAWVRGQAAPGDVIFPYSPVYLEALDTTQHVTAVHRDEAEGVRRALRRVDPPVRRTVLAVPLGDAPAPSANAVEARLPGATVAVFPQWLLVARDGPFATDAEVLRSLLDSVEAVRAEVRRPPERLGHFFRRAVRGLRGALEALGQQAGRQVAGTPRLASMSERAEARPYNRPW